MEIDGMSFWQLKACADGFNRANSPDEAAPAPSNDEFDVMLEKLNKMQPKMAIN